MKCFNKIAIYILFSVVPFLGLHAQQQLSLQQAVKIALENNYDIKLSNTQNEIYKNDVNYGNAGFLPSVTGNLNQVSRIETSKVDLASGEVRSADNAKSSNLTYGVSLNWKIFDGLQMFANYERLAAIQQQGELNAQLTIQTTIADVIDAYYDLMTQQKQLEATHIAIDVSLIRLKNANSRYILGKGSKLELLAAKVDLSTDTTDLLRQEDVIKSGKINLNKLMARALDTDFSIDETIDIDKSLVYENLKPLMFSQNFELQNATINQKISELYIKQVKGARYPSVALTSGYNFSNSTSPPTGFTLRSNVKGLNYGVTASFNIFNGFQQNRVEKNAKLELETAKFELERTKQNVDAQLLTAFQNYQTNIKLLNLEQKNIGVAKENLDITLEKYRLGSIVPLELREAQRNYLSANARYSNALYLTKLAELSIKELTGSIQL